jgi:TPR repeat protein
LNEALLWFGRAVKLGDADANLNIAKLYLEHRANPILAIRFLKETSKSRNATVGSKEEARKLLTQLNKAGRRPRAH